MPNGSQEQSRPATYSWPTHASYNPLIKQSQPKIHSRFIPTCCLKYPPTQKNALLLQLYLFPVVFTGQCHMDYCGNTTVG